MTEFAVRVCASSLMALMEQIVKSEDFGPVTVRILGVDEIISFDSWNAFQRIVNKKLEETTNSIIVPGSQPTYAQYAVLQKALQEFANLVDPRDYLFRTGSDREAVLIKLWSVDLP